MRPDLDIAGGSNYDSTMKRNSLQILADHLKVSRQRVLQLIKQGSPRVEEAIKATGVKPDSLVHFGHRESGPKKVGLRETAIVTKSGEPRYPRVMFHVGQELERELMSRTGPIETKVVISGSAFGMVTRRDVNRYYLVLKDKLADLNLTFNQASAICRALKPHLEEIDSRLLWKDFHRFVPDLPRQGPAALDQLQALAVIDAVERLYKNHPAPTAAALREVGLIR